MPISRAQQFTDGSSGVLFDHFFQATTTTPSGAMSLASGVAGTGAAVSAIATPDAAALGVNQLSTGTTTTGRAGIATSSGTVFRFGGGGVVSCDWRFQMPTLLDGTDSGAIYLGFGDGLTGAPVDGAYVYWDNTQAHFRYRTRSNSSETDADSGVTPAAGAWYVVRIAGNAAGTAVTFQIGTPGVASLANAQDITTTIPTASGRDTTLFALIVKSAGTTARVLYLDYVRFAWSGMPA